LEFPQPGLYPPRSPGTKAANSHVLFFLGGLGERLTPYPDNHVAGCAGARFFAGMLDLDIAFKQRIAQ
jgi:hypothetical protein